LRSLNCPQVQGWYFSRALGIQPALGVPARPEDVQTIGHSEFGSSFLSLEKIPMGEKSNRSYRSRKRSLNWSAEQVALLLQLVSMSLSNVVSALRIANGVSPADVKFVRPVEKDAFERPWRLTPRVTSFTMDYELDPKYFEKTTKQQLRKVLRSTDETADSDC